MRTARPTKKQSARMIPFDPVNQKRICAMAQCHQRATIFVGDAWCCGFHNPSQLDLFKEGEIFKPVIDKIIALEEEHGKQI